MNHNDYEDVIFLLMKILSY